MTAPQARRGLERNAIDTELRVETAEHVVFDYRLAGPARRALANGIDVIVSYVIFAIVVVIAAIALVGFAGISQLVADAAGIGMGLVLVLTLLHGAVSGWLRRGETLGEVPARMGVGTLVALGLVAGAALLVVLKPVA